MKIESIAILGGGAWGTALAIALAPRFAVRLWLRDVSQADAMALSRENDRYLPGFKLPISIAIDPFLTSAIDQVDLLIIATPSGVLPEILEALYQHRARAPLVWLCKGFIDNGEGKPRLAHQHVKARWSESFGVLSGPSFAEEVARGLPTALTLASPDAEFAACWAARLRTERLRIYSSADIVGVEVGGALKNVLAIAAGISDGLRFGNNARAALITRGLVETGRLSQALGGRRETLMGLAGLGDLVLTTTSDLSRNRRLGLALARGESLEQAVKALGHIVEGVPTAHAVAQVASSLSIEMPICRAVYCVLYENVSPRVAVEELLSREPGME